MIENMQLKRGLPSDNNDVRADNKHRCIWARTLVVRGRCKSGQDSATVVASRLDLTSPDRLCRRLRTRRGGRSCQWSILSIFNIRAQH